ncbi:hypothetical protein ACHHYP_16757 [Achlya hypogyna]|uniref:Uncharacterized protein n=1 Tax=Achlya hypogyna TaxID=1202772 RepID=A0A1V9Y5V2_ACHHY|nr:hypothetical protein ACHHYP_16757 [Achlya hypogyna]
MTLSDMGQIARHLPKRLDTELGHYFPSATDHQLVAMMCDPVMLTCALPWLELNGHGDDVERAHNVILEAMEQEAKRSRHLAMTVIGTTSAVAGHSVASGNISSPGQGLGNGVVASGTFDSADGKDLKNGQDGEDSEDGNEKAIFDLPAAMLLDDGCEYGDDGLITDELTERAFCAWTSCRINWSSFLKDQQKLQLTKKDEARVEALNWACVSRLVGVSLLWRVNGHAHRLVERVAAREFACPDSNGLQERVFYLRKILDSPLRQNISNKKFEMLLLLSFNKKFVQEPSTGRWS